MIVANIAESGPLLNHWWYRDHQTLLPPFSFLLALLVGCALAGGNLVEGAPLRLHPDMGVAREHDARDVPGDAHDHLVARARLGQFGDEVWRLSWWASRSSEPPRRSCTEAGERSDLSGLRKRFADLVEQH